MITARTRCTGVREKKEPDVYNEKREDAERSAVNESPSCLAAP